MRLRIGIGGSVINGNSIQLFVFGTYSGILINYIGMFLTIIKITYLVIPSEYSNLITSISVTSDLLNLNISAGANIEIYKTLPLQLSSLDFICTSYLTSIDILMNVASLTLGIDYSLTILNTTTYKLKISNIG